MPVAGRPQSVRWQDFGAGERGITLFIAVVPPNSKQYPWKACRFAQAVLAAHSMG